jgi:hypothetical protein
MQKYVDKKCNTTQYLELAAMPTLAVRGRVGSLGPKLFTLQGNVHGGNSMPAKKKAKKKKH